MLYELRHYTPGEGKADALSARFRDHVLPIMRRVGLLVHDFWEAADGSGQLWYVMAWRDEAEMNRMWPVFRGDAEWLAARKAMEVEGVPFSSSTSVLLRRVPFFRAENICPPRGQSDSAAEHSLHRAATPVDDNTATPD